MIDPQELRMTRATQVRNRRKLALKDLQAPTRRTAPHAVALAVGDMLADPEAMPRVSRRRSGA